MQKVTSRLLQKAQETPDDIRILERVDIANLVDETNATDDQVEVLLLDLETTSLDTNNCEIIELGLLQAKYSPSLNKFTQLSRAKSYLQQPSQPLADEIIEVTGLTDEILKNQSFSAQDIEKYLTNDPIILAHNAKFDRKIFDRYFPEHSNLRWGCTLSEADYSSLKIRSRRQEDLISEIGYFYSGHRASNDVEALAFLLHKLPDALKSLFESVSAKSYQIKAIGSPFETKNELKLNEFRWNNQERVWYKDTSDLDLTLTFLDNLYGGASRASVAYFDARNRFK